MRKLVIFLFNLIIECRRNQIIDRASGLTLRVLMAFFPFFIFLMALMGFLELDVDAILGELYLIFPEEISQLLSYFIVQFSETRSTGVLSAALFFSVTNATSGFRAIIRHTNMAYDVREKRGFVAQYALSFVLMILFSLALVVMLALLVFGPQGIIDSAAALLILFMFTSLIYKISCAQPLPFRHVFPGAAVTVSAWVTVSAVFSEITRDFTQFPAIYGSIAGIFVLILWINTVSLILLFGSELNALLREYK